MEPDFDEAEARKRDEEEALSQEEAGALEQTELRKRLEEEVEEEMAHRATEAREHHEHADPEWKPPEELAPKKGGGVLLRFFIFLLLLAGLWFLFQQGSRIFLKPDLEALAPVVPEGRLPVGRPVTVGIQMANPTRFDGKGFTVAVLASGQEIQGPEVDVPGRDTVVVPVNVALPAGDHVLSLVAFNSWGQEQRIAAFRGLTLWISDTEIELGDVTLPEALATSDTVTVEFSATNPGDAVETVVPLLVFTPAEGEAIEIDGPVTELPAGSTETLQVTIVAAMLDPGSYSVQVRARTPEGQSLARAEGSTTVRVHTP